ncbi:ketosteroid isomerase [Fusarium albosuccineum]|uniref:Ketosteroid isomerase n=1 Tax=Fusarium albosuccineum TaxID=1237068 RepID=A0A8H4LCV8_9HYPO|nr:ketosteroid isomerase [Fusarium albosuccineum]
MNWKKEVRDRFYHCGGTAQGSEYANKQGKACESAIFQSSFLTNLEYHDPALKATEEEILDFYKKFGNFLNHLSHTDVPAGKAFFDLNDYHIFDLMGNVNRPNLEAHYDHITPYLGKTNQQFREVEIVAVTTEFGYITAIQRVDGTAADGSPYDFSFRSTSMLRKFTDGWKFVHEHYSFPVDMATKIADFTGKQGATESVEFKKK